MTNVFTCNQGKSCVLVRPGLAYHIHKYGALQKTTRANFSVSGQQVDIITASTCLLVTHYRGHDSA